MYHHTTHKRLYEIWCGIKKRCQNRLCCAFKWYGKRGIKVCHEWNISFPTFAEWADANGYAPNLILDRMDNSKGYSPENCRWTTHKVNNNNRRDNVMVSAFGENKTLAQWSEDERCEVTYDTLYYRIKLARVKPEKAISTPNIRHKRKGLS